MQKNIYNPRDFRDIELTDTNPVLIASQDFHVFDIDERYEPYDELVMINNSDTSDCEVTINFSVKRFLSRRTSLNYNQPFRDVRVQNIGSLTINPDEIIIYYRHHSKKSSLINNASNLVAGIGFLRGFN